LQDPDLETRLTAARSLRQLADRRALPHLARALRADFGRGFRAVCWVVLLVVELVALVTGTLPLLAVVVVGPVSLLALYCWCARAEQAETRFYLALGEAMAAIAERQPCPEAHGHLPSCASGRCSARTGWPPPT
jgi:Flp pilus assembly protein TadB